MRYKLMLARFIKPKLQNLNLELLLVVALSSLSMNDLHLAAGCVLNFSLKTLLLR